MTEAAVVIAAAFVGAVVWLVRNWHAKGPTDLWHDDDITATSSPSRPRSPARLDPHVDGPVLAIGYWGRGWDDPELPDAHAFVDPSWEAAERDAVVGHLDAGRPVEWWSPDAVTCAFCGTTTGPGERTDGVYLWPEGLAHTVEAHQVRLPGVFVLHVRTANAERRREPDLSWLDHHPIPSIDETWWRSLEGP